MLLARDRAVVRAHEDLARELVQGAGEPLGQAAAVDEDERRLVRLDQLEQARMDCRPDRRPGVADRRRSAWDFISSREPRHVLDRHLDLELEALLRACIDDGDRPVVDRCSRRRELVANLLFDRGFVDGVRLRASASASGFDFGFPVLSPDFPLAARGGRFFRRTLVADSPIRCGGRSQFASSRSSESARCAPRLVGTSA